MKELEREADRVLRGILEEFPDLRVESPVHLRTNRPDLVVEAVSGKAKFCFHVQVKSRITPQTALSVCEQHRGLPKGVIPVVFAPTISSRVAQILREQDVGYADRAGNCYLRSSRDHLLVERQGFRAERQPTPAASDAFAAKSSRIVRLLLTHPGEGWQVRKLAEHPDVGVSPGLVVKVKRALVEEGYAIERGKHLYVRDPLALLEAWTQKYPGPAEEVAVYVRGDTTAAENTIGRWCRDNSLRFALAGFSAAWRLAPEVRYSVAAVYLEDSGFTHRLLEQLAGEYGGKQVGTGANLYLWRPFDPSAFAGSLNAGQPAQPVTSPLQTYLDLKRAAGRGEDAAQAVFEKHLSRDLQTAVKPEEELHRGAS